MRYLYNSPALKQQRRNLRKNQTDSESKLWYYLRNRRFKGLRFSRQFSLGNYILDFYCPGLRLAIEIDGGHHAENKIYDEERTRYLQTQHKIAVLRFWNNDVLKNIEGVIAKINEVVDSINNPS